MRPGHFPKARAIPPRVTQSDRIVRLTNTEYAERRIVGLWVRRAILGLACLLLGAADSSLGQDAPPTQALIEYRFVEMGIEFRLLVCGSDPKAFQPLGERCRQRVHALNQIFSDYIATSEVGALKSAAVGIPQRVSPELYRLVEQSLAISQASHGAFDITIGPLTRLWRTARRTRQLPEPQIWAAAHAAVGWQNIQLIAPDLLQLARPGIELDFGGIAQGFAADECLRILQAAGWGAALVDASGDIAIGDPPPDHPHGWRVAFGQPVLAQEDAPSAKTPQYYLELANCGISTSGDQYQFLELDGQRLSHLLDPRTGEPVRDAPQVTVLANDATTADAYASALSVLTREEGLRLIEAEAGGSAVWLRPVPGGTDATESPAADQAERWLQKSSRFPELRTPAR